MQTPNNLKVCEGLTKRQINQLIKFTITDPLIVKTTNDVERFKDFQTYKQWLNKKRSPYSLIDKENNLQGIIWFGIKQMPKNIHFSESLITDHYSITFAIRLYEHARGKHLSHKFIKAAWEMYSKSEEYLRNSNKGLWLETNINNFVAVSSYKRVGFALVTKPDKEGKVIMIQS